MNDIKIVMFSGIKYISISDAIKILPLSRMTIHRLIADGEIRSKKISIKKIFVNLDDIKERIS